MRPAQIVSTVVELAGMAAIVAGVAMFSVPVAFVVAGVGLVLLGLSIGVGVDKR
jgi:hypothetical protein